MESATLDFASWPIRLVAYLIDDILPIIGGILIVMGLFFGLFWGIESLFEDDGVSVIGEIGVLAIIGLLVTIMGAGILIGYVVWWLVALGRAQTPGKQIVGIRAVDYAGEPLGWGMMFVREFLFKRLLFGSLYALTLGILFLVDNLWPLWDDNNQTLHDKVVNTYVVYVPKA